MRLADGWFRAGDAIRWGVIAGYGSYAQPVFPLVQMI